MSAIAKMEPPPNWLEMVENIRAVRKRFPAPVDTMGCDQVHKNNDKTIDQRFQVLVSLMLSSQTKDPITWGAVQKLKEHGLGNVDGMLGAAEKDIEDLIYPVGFYRRKAIYLKKVVKILKETYNGDIPKSIKDLCSLPGVGPKMAHLCMSEAWRVVTGIGVDTHVHRISSRLGWVPSKGIKTPEDTRKALESWLPYEYWSEINHLLVGFGQTICAPIRPKCEECYNQALCPYLKSNPIAGGSGKRKTASKVSSQTKKQLKIEREDETLPDECESGYGSSERPKIKNEPEFQSEMEPKYTTPESSRSIEPQLMSECELRTESSRVDEHAEPSRIKQEAEFSVSVELPRRSERSVKRPPTYKEAAVSCVQPCRQSGEKKRTPKTEAESSEVGSPAPETTVEIPPKRSCTAKPISTNEQAIDENSNQIRIKIEF